MTEMRKIGKGDLGTEKKTKIHEGEREIEGDGGNERGPSY